MAELAVRDEPDYRAVVARVRAGVPVAEAAEIMGAWAIAESDFARVLGISEHEWRQVQSARVDRVLTPVESDRLMRVAQVFAHASSIFDSEREAVTWFSMPNAALSGEPPMSWLDTDAGVHHVDDVLTRLEFGVYG